MGQIALVRVADTIGRRTQHAFHQRNDEAVADRHHEIGAPVAQRTIGNCNILPDIGDEIGHQPRFGTDIFDVDRNAGLAVKGIRQEFAVEMADVGTDLRDRLAVGEPSREFREQGGVDGRGGGFCAAAFAMIMPPCFRRRDSSSPARRHRWTAVHSWRWSCGHIRARPAAPSRSYRRSASA